jgi:hypothetical protein
MEAPQVRKFLSIVVLALVAAPAALAAPPPIAVPPAVIAAHPGGEALTATVQTVTTTVSPFAAERISCWRSYFTGDNGGWVGTEQETINPGWCGNGTALRSADSSWHYESCSLLVNCTGETGVGTWLGCANGCSSLGQQITGHFRVNVGVLLSVDETVIYQLYGNGQSWYYAYHN